MVDNDRREYQRIKVDAMCQFLLANEGRDICDFSGVIDNISEQGIGIIIEDSKWFEVVEKIDVGEELFFQAIDEYELYKSKVSEVILGKARILRKNVCDGKYVMGCKFTSNSKDLQEYVSKRKLALFWKNEMGIK